MSDCFVSYLYEISCCCLVAKVRSSSLQPHGLQLARLFCPPLSPGVWSNSCPLSLWCHPTTSILCHSLLLLPSIFPSIRVFPVESGLRIRWPKYWSFSVRSSSEYSGLISFRIDWFDLLAVQGTFKSLLQHHSLKTSILWGSAFLNGQYLYNYKWWNYFLLHSIRKLIGTEIRVFFCGFWHQTYFGLRVPALINVTLGYHSES